MRVGVKTYLNLQPSICIHDSSYYGHHSSLTDVCDKLLFNSDTKICATLLICNLEVVTNIVIITNMLMIIDLYGKEEFDSARKSMYIFQRKKCSWEACGYQ